MFGKNSLPNIIKHLQATSKEVYFCLYIHTYTHIYIYTYVLLFSWMCIYSKKCPEDIWVFSKLCRAPDLSPREPLAALSTSVPFGGDAWTILESRVGWPNMGQLRKLGEFFSRANWVSQKSLHFGLVKYSYDIICQLIQLYGMTMSEAIKWRCRFTFYQGTPAVCDHLHAWFNVDQCNQQRNAYMVSSWWLEHVGAAFLLVKSIFLLVFLVKSHSC